MKNMDLNNAELTRFFVPDQKASVLRISSQLSDRETMQAYRIVASNGLVAEFLLNRSSDIVQIGLRRF